MTTEHDLRDSAGAVVRAANRAVGVATAQLLQSRAGAEKAQQHAAATARSAAALRQRAGVAAAAQGTDRLQELLGELAPGPLSGDWDTVDFVGDVDILSAASHVRCGDVIADRLQGRERLPLVVPLLDHGNLVVDAASHSPAVTGLVQEVTLRALLGTGAGQLTLSSFDPELVGAMAPFTPLRAVSEDLVQPTLASESDLTELLLSLTRDVRRISDMYGGAPTTLGRFRRSAGQPIERYRLVVVLNYPLCFDDRTHAQLLTLMRSGPSCGVSFVVHRATDVTAPDGVATSHLGRVATVLDLDDGPGCARLPGVPLSVGVPPDVGVLTPALAALQVRARAAAAPRIDLATLQPARLGYWQESSAERLTAVIGRAGHAPVEITLGDEREQRHNILVSGAVGQGKSNLLMALVHSWAVRYSPDELEMYLLDLKDGVTLFPLAPRPGRDGWLPHARVLGLESDRTYAAAVLRHLVSEFERRAVRIRPHGDNITRYRVAQPDQRMPRVVLVVDEFQTMFEEDDDVSRSALLDLERLAKKGRAYGIHVVLASQTLSGITPIMAKQDGIFSQFPTRLALRNSPSESRAVLAQDNPEASRLRYRGEMVVNHDFGAPEGNARAVVALADPAELEVVRRDLWSRLDDPVPPATFNGAESPDLISHLPRVAVADPDRIALLGLPVAVDATPLGVDLGARSGRHVSVVGAGEVRVSDELKLSAGAVVLQACAVSLGRSSPAGAARFVVVNLLGARSPDQLVVDSMVDLLAEDGHAADVVGAADLADLLATLAGEIAERRSADDPAPLYLFLFGMDRAPNLREWAPEGAPVDGLHALWRDGSQVHVHVLGWWSNTSKYQEHVGIEARGMVDAHVLLRMSGQEAVDFLGPFVPWSGSSNRGLLNDTAVGDARVFVPFAPLLRSRAHDSGAA